MNTTDSYQPLDFEVEPFAAQDEVNEGITALVAHDFLGSVVTAADLAAGIVKIADRQHSEWPHYKGEWDGPQWHLVRFVEDVVTKGGLRFAKGDYTIADLTERRMSFSAVGNPYTGAYSIRGAINCSVRSSSFEVI